MRETLSNGNIGQKTHLNLILALLIMNWLALFGIGLDMGKR